MEKLKKETNESFERTKNTVPCNYAKAELWSDCRICNGMKNDKTQPAFHCTAWVPETNFGDSDP